MAMRVPMLLAGLAALSACGGREEVPQAPCPRIALLAEGADLTRFRPGAGRDLTALLLDARIAGFDARCDWTTRDRQAVTVALTPRFEAERGPAAEGRVAELPWFVALTDAGDSTVLAREAQTTRLTFPANADRAGATGQPARVTVPLGDGRRAGEMTLRVSFQLSAEELALNRARLGR